MPSVIQFNLCHEQTKKLQINYINIVAMEDVAGLHRKPVRQLNLTALTASCGFLMKVVLNMETASCEEVNSE